MRQPDGTQTESASPAETGSVMTMEGTVHKAGFLVVLLALGAAFPFFGPASITNVVASLILPLVGATFGIALAIAFRPHLASKLAVAYALIQGLVLGTLSRLLDERYPGIASQALLLTISIAAAMLFLYRAKIINVTRNFRIAVTAATLGIALAYLASFIGGFIGFKMPLLHDNSTAGILVSVFIVGLAAANLALDFDFIESGVEQKYPSGYEWVAAFGLVVTIAWMYLEILRLLAKLRSRD